MRVVVTGMSGFVGGHLARRLTELGHEAIRGGRDELALDNVDAVVHLAGTRSGSPSQLAATNVVGTARVLEQTCRLGLRTVVVGSSAIYGASSDKIDETAMIAPITAYGASKAATEIVARQMFAATNAPIVRARPFNIIGPAQRGDYLAVACARQIVAIERGATPRILRLGNLASSRDFVDVRDVVDALVVLAKDGEAGEAYNICSGVATPIRALIDSMIEAVGGSIEVEHTPPRSDDVSIQVGSAAKLSKLGWSQKYSLAASVRDLLADLRADQS
ncbi:MAG TPA: NAD-dependent epimerase/dehydratase family protein [Kofleriaceae bacterium]|jgi:GDP-4-dehydro-6-deoxy-D-mannose reductase